MPETSGRKEKTNRAKIPVVYASGVRDVLSGLSAPEIKSVEAFLNQAMASRPANRRQFLGTTEAGLVVGGSIASDWSSLVVYLLRRARRRRRSRDARP